MTLTTILLGIAALTAVTPDSIIDRIDTNPYRADASFAVTMPQLPDDVIYSLSISQTPAPTDTLCPAAYLIDWKITQRPGMSGPTAADEGFTAYFDGNYYSLMAERLRERHIVSDPNAFTRPARGGIALSSQFADLVPAVMALRLREMASDPRYTLIAVPDTVVGGEKAIALLTRMSVDGSIASEGEYIFYPGEKLTPRSIVLENNTGSIGEQTITVKYDRRQELTSPAPAPVNEDDLIAVYPEEFERYRTSVFRLETLPGHHLPAIAAPTIGGGRYARNASQKLDAPTAIVVLEARSEFTPKVIEAVRSAALQLPWRIDIVWAFADTNPDDIEAVIPSAPDSETVLTSARAVARDCGAGSMMPAVIFAGRNGIVTGFVAGYNNSLESDVVKNMMGIQP